MGLVSLRSSLGASNDMQHDLFGSPRDLGLRSNIDFDISRSFHICFDAS